MDDAIKCKKCNKSDRYLASRIYVAKSILFSSRVDCNFVLAIFTVMNFNWILTRRCVGRTRQNATINNLSFESYDKLELSMLENKKYTYSDNYTTMVKCYFKIMWSITP